MNKMIGRCPRCGKSLSMNLVALDKDVIPDGPDRSIEPPKYDLLVEGGYGNIDLIPFVRRILSYLLKRR